MKKAIYFSCWVGLILTLFSCKNDAESIFDKDENAVNQYVSDNNLIGEKTQNGVFYSINQEGNGNPVLLNSIVVLNYTLFLPTGEEVYAEDGYLFRPEIGAFLYGITEGTFGMNEGEKRTLVIPSLLALGGESWTIGDVTIPANSILIVEVEITELRTDADQLAVESQQIEDTLKAHNYDWKKTEEGLYYVPLIAGSGEDFPQLGEVATVDYDGTLLNRRRFDAGSNFSFQVGTPQIIVGWNIGIQTMKKGDTALWFMPSALAYGDAGSGGDIPPFSPLIFEITLNAID